MNSIFTKVSLIFYSSLMALFYSSFSFGSISLFILIIFLIILYKTMELKFIYYLRVPFLILSLFIAFEEYGTWKGFEPASILFSTLVLLKIFELKTKRDVHSLLLIQFLHILSLSLLVEDFYYLFVIVLSLVYFFGSLYLLEQFEVEERVVRNSCKKVLTLSVLGLPILVFLFLSFPRINFGLGFFSSSVAVTGFSEDLKPGDIAEIVNDPSTVFHVSFTSPLERHDMYWRGQILAKNDLFNWSKTKLPEIRNNTSIYKKYDYLVGYDSPSGGPLFSLEKTRKLKLTSLGSLSHLKGDLYHVVPIRNQKIRYKGWLGVELPARLSEGHEKIYLQTNVPVNSLTIELRDKNKHLLGKATEVALFLKDFFRKNFKYSTVPGVYEKENPLDEFLFEKRLGFCGHFSSASATLFRLFSVPSRVVVGYQGGAYNEVGDFYVIAQKDAHSWVEYLSEDGIWTRFDAVSVVSPERIAYGADAYFEYEKLGSNNLSIESFISGRSGLLSEWKQFVQSFYYKTGTLFFNYDLESQKKLLDRVVAKDYSKLVSKNHIIPLLGSLLLMFTIFFRRKVQSFILFICINKYKRVSFKRYLTLTGKEIIDVIDARPASLVLLIHMYESLSYSRGVSISKELSFLPLAFKILIYG